MFNEIFSINIEGRLYTLPLSSEELEEVTENKALEDVVYTFNDILIDIDLDVTDLEGFNLDTLNDLSEELSTIEGEEDTVNAYMEENGTSYFLSNYNKIIKKIRENEIVLHKNMDGQEYAEMFVTDCYFTENIPSIIYNNIDWQGVFDDLEEAIETSYGVLSEIY